MSAVMRDVREIVREEMLMRDKILSVLGEESMTVPELAEALGHPAYEVMFWVMGMRKYGYLAEKELSDEGYYKYGAVPREGV